MKKLISALKQLRRPLKQSNVNRYKDIYTKLAIKKAQLEATPNPLRKDPQHRQLQAKEREDRIRYLDKLDSSIKLMHQQSNLDGYTKMTNARNSFLQK